MATHSGVLAWRIPGTGEPGGLPSMGSHRVGHDWSDLTTTITTLVTNKPEGKQESKKKWRVKVRARARAREIEGEGSGAGDRDKQRHTQIDIGSIHNSVQENTMVLRLKWNHWGKSRAWHTRNGNMKASRKKVQADFRSRKITEHQFVNGLDSGSYCKKMLSVLRLIFPFSALCLASAPDTLVLLA